MAHHSRDFGIGQLQLVDQAGVENDLAAGAAVGVELVALDHVDFPFPVRRIGAKLRRLGNQPIGDRLHALGGGAGPVQRVVAGRFAQRLLIRLCIHLVDLIGRQHAEHVLLALDADGAATGGVHRLATGQQHAGTQQADYERSAHGVTP